MRDLSGVEWCGLLGSRTWCPEMMRLSAVVCDGRAQSLVHTGSWVMLVGWLVGGGGQRARSRFASWLWL